MVSDSVVDLLRSRDRSDLSPDVRQLTREKSSRFWRTVGHQRDEVLDGEKAIG